MLVVLFQKGQKLISSYLNKYSFLRCREGENLEDIVKFTRRYPTFQTDTRSLILQNLNTRTPKITTDNVPPPLSQKIATTYSQFFAIV